MKKILELLIPPILGKIGHKISEILTPRRPQKYRMGDYEIQLPANSKHPYFRKKFLLYDRFLPVLVKYLDSEKQIIDVGANVGTTAVAIFQNCENPIVCIEPSDVFLPFLKKNLEHLPNQKTRVHVFQNLIGTGNFPGTLKYKNHGTATLEVTETEKKSHTSLDELSDSTLSEIVLLKSDTDGFDFDVIFSAKEILTQTQPVLFFENEINESFQKEGFDSLYPFLTEKGYKHFFVFDNFGNLILENASVSALKNLNEYLWSMERFGKTRTIYYVDILAATDRYFSNVQKAISEFKKDWIFTK